PSNGTPDLIAQIENGMSEADLAYHGGELGLDPSTGQLLLNGDTGISGGLKAGLEAIVGKPRSLFLYESVAGVGDNAEYTIVGFAGIRIVDFQLGGPQDANGNTHYIIMQPSVVIDDAAVAGNGQSYSVYQPVVLVR
ncbi:MAG TPA: hypothetical protein VE890_13695, partial [Thermoguttaceae bacterium]|nr:hypothetical protein [Thermoguttaceae bacterium]